jgi:hypothetical protein
VTANRNDPRDANNAPYRRATARLARAMLALREAANEVLALAPDGYEPEVSEDRDERDYTWQIMTDEAELLSLVLKHPMSCMDCTLSGGMEGFVEDFEAEEGKEPPGLRVPLDAESRHKLRLVAHYRKQELGEYLALAVGLIVEAAWNNLGAVPNERFPAEAEPCAVVAYNGR